MEDWKTAVMAFVGGSLMPWMLNLFKTKSDVHQSQFDILTQKYKELYDEIKSANAECEEKYKHLMDELFELKSKIN